MVTDKGKKAKRPIPEIIKELGAEVEKMYNENPPKSIKAICQTIKGNKQSYLTVLEHLKGKMNERGGRTYRTGKDSESVVSGSVGSGSVGQ